MTLIKISVHLLASMSVTVSTFIDDCKKDLSGQHHVYSRHMAMYKNMVFAIDEVSYGFSNVRTEIFI